MPEELTAGREPQNKMTTYLYEVHYTQNGKMDHRQIRATDKLDAVRKVAGEVGDLTPVDASRVGN